MSTERRCKLCGVFEPTTETRCPMRPSGLHEFQAEPEPEPGHAPYQPSSIEWWIARVDQVVQESPQMGTEPILGKAAVMAQLYTVQVMQRLVEIVTAMTVCMEQRERAGVYQRAVLERIAEALQQRNRQEEESKTLGERAR
jgi:hypothetical protein